MTRCGDTKWICWTDCSDMMPGRPASSFSYPATWPPSNSIANSTSGTGLCRATFHHIIRNMEEWSAQIADRTEAPGQSEDLSIRGLIERLDRTAPLLAGVAYDVAARNGWDERWSDTLADPPVELTYGGTIAHVITHSMHHRAQVLYMLRGLGVEKLPEGDVLSWEDQLR